MQSYLIMFTFLRDCYEIFSLFTKEVEIIGRFAPRSGTILHIFTESAEFLPTEIVPNEF